MTSSPLTESLLRGVAANPGAPSDVLLRLLRPEGKPAWSTLRDTPLPPDVVEAVITHPDRAVRRIAARNRYVAPEQRGRLADDPDERVRASVASGPRRLRLDRVPPLPDEALVTLLTAQDHPDRNEFLTADEIRAELTASFQIPRSFILRAMDHPDPRIRAFAADSGWQLTAEQRDALLADPDPAVRAAAHRASRYLDPAAMEAELPERDCHHRSVLLCNFAISDAVAEACLASGRNLWALAGNPHTPAHAVARLAHDPDPEVRARVASRHDLDAVLLAELAEDLDAGVRSRALVQALHRRWKQYGVIDEVTGWTADQIGPPVGPHDTSAPDWYRACAESEHPVLRRIAAAWPGLPEDLVAALAADPDPEVRHPLAYHHPLAPPEVLLSAFVATPGERPYLLTLPSFPRTGLQRLLVHEDPGVRALAAADPTLDHPPVELLTDPDERVRQSAAANPLLPADLLGTLLDDPAHAEGAAANPTLSAEQLHHLLDRTGLPAGCQCPGA
ncbi:hypothetical protein F7Q99_33215 [Streptomyces kaniharaensis]|uniref:LRV domain-containing protein n=1 Tax=Streptomyces kaniharaensis TaxID=212423 RepID=A0A6N7KZE3_9ACTN|nr:hypothetical protein [Streptomyces kaniharaensis]MQS16920.1 hypothetical protein [Streptomyces kaniharaensis]